MRRIIVERQYCIEWRVTWNRQYKWMNPFFPARVEPRKGQPSGDKAGLRTVKEYDVIDHVKCSVTIQLSDDSMSGNGLLIDKKSVKT